MELKAKPGGLRLRVLVAALFVAWGAGSAWRYACDIRGSCSTPSEPAAAKAAAVAPPPPALEISAAAPAVAAQSLAPPAPEWTSERPFLFVWGRAEPTVGPPFGAWKDVLAQEGADDRVLEIVGLWYAGEKNDPRVGDLGLARAMRVRELLADRVPAHRIFLRSRSESRATADQRGLFDAVRVRWIGASPQLPVREASTPSALGSGAAPIPRTPAAALPAVPAQPPRSAETVSVGVAAPGPARTAGEDRIALLFDSGASMNTLDSATVNRLRALVQRAADGGRTLLVVGHTDSLGDEQTNLALGLQRANQVREWLATDVAGAQQARLRAESMGSFQPVAGNDTEEGRRRNRRVEVYLLP